MEAFDCISTRRSVRKFTPKPVDRETLRRIISSAQLAPSWKNTQCSRFTAIVSPESISQVAHLLSAEESKLGDWNAKIVSGASALVLVSVLPGQSGHEKDGTPSTAYGEGYTFFDCGCAVENICLAAHARGIGSVILGHFDFDAVGKVSQLPRGERPIVLIAMGYQAGAGPAAPVRKPLDEVLRFI